MLYHSCAVPVNFAVALGEDNGLLLNEVDIQMGMNLIKLLLPSHSYGRKFGWLSFSELCPLSSVTWSWKYRSVPQSALQITSPEKFKITFGNLL